MGVSVVDVLLAGDFPVSPPMVTGGIQAVTWHLAEGLADVPGIRLDVFSHETWATPPARRSWVASYGGISATYTTALRWMPTIMRTWSSDALALQNHVRRRRPDVVHAHGQRGYAVGALRSGVPTVVTVHGLYAREKRAGEGPWTLRSALKERAWRSTEEWVLRRARHVIIISPYVRAFVEPRTSARLHDIPNPISEAFFAMDRTPLRRPPLRRPQLLTVGEITPRKRQRLLLQAFARIVGEVPGARLRVVGGPGPSDPEASAYAASVWKLARDLEIARSVDFLGRLPQEDLLDEYRSADLYVHAAAEESSPMAIAQALAAGVPAVAFDIPGVRHLITPGETGARAVDGEADSLAATVVRLVAHPDHLAALSVASKRFAEATFAAAAVAARTSEVYMEVQADTRHAARRPGLGGTTYHRHGL